MPAQVRQLLEWLQTGLWLVPTLLTVAATATAVGLVYLEAAVVGSASELPWVLRASASGARDVLSVVATSTVTVLGVVFSLTIVALQLASSQYTPRVLTTFTSDRGNQLVLGTFVGTFTASLIVLRIIRTPEEGQFVPALAVAWCLLLALVSVAALVFFIHHLAARIQVSNILAQLATATTPLIDATFPAPDTAAPRLLPPAFDGDDTTTIAARDSGYIQVVDASALAEIAARHDLVLRVERGVGDFVPAGAPLIVARPAGPVDAVVRRALGRHVALGPRRTLQEDPEFGVRLVMEIAVKALSPGINDPSTAVMAVDQLTAIVRRAAARQDPPSVACDRDGRARVLLHVPDFTTLLGQAFDQVRQSAVGNAAVTLRLLRALRDVAGATGDPARRRAIAAQAEAIVAGAARGVPAAIDRRTIAAAAEEVGRALGLRLAVTDLAA